MSNRYGTEWSDPPPDEIELVVLVDGIADPVCHLARGETDPEWWAVIVECLSDEMNDQYKHWRPSPCAASTTSDDGYARGERSQP